MGSSKILDWMPSLSTPDFKDIEAVPLELEQYLTLRTYLDGYQLSSTERGLWTTLRTKPSFAKAV